MQSDPIRSSQFSVYLSKGSIEISIWPICGGPQIQFPALSDCVEEGILGTFKMSISFHLTSEGWFERETSKCNTLRPQVWHLSHTILYKWELVPQSMRKGKVPVPFYQKIKTALPSDNKLRCPAER